MQSILRTNKPDKWNILSNPQFLAVLFYLVELKYKPGKKDKKHKEKAKIVLKFYQKLSEFWVGRIPSGKHNANSQNLGNFSKKVPTKVLKFLCQEGEFERALNIIDRLMMKKIFMNEPELYHYKTIVKMLEIRHSEIKRLEMNKLMIESTSVFSKQLSLFSNKDIAYFENNMLYLNELKEFKEIKTFYLRVKIPAEYYSIRVAPLLIKCVGSTRRAENLCLQHPYSPQ